MLANANKVRAYLEALPQRGSAGAFLITHGDDVVVNMGIGFANAELRAPNTPQTLFDIASIAKVFTALAVFKLQEEQKLDLADPIARLLSGTPADKQSITIYHLLTHTSGLELYHSENDFDPITRDEAVAATLNAPLRWQPGTREGYSNGGYALLGAIVELATGQPFQQYLRSRLLQPLGMTSTGWFGEADLPAERIAHGYVAGEDKGAPADWPLTWALLAGGGMVSSAEDLYRLHRGLQSDELLSAAAKRIMYQPALKKWACGWEALQTGFGALVKKGGSSDYGFTGWLANYVEQEVALILLFNSYDEEYGNNTHNQIGEEVPRLLLAG